MAKFDDPKPDPEDSYCDCCQFQTTELTLVDAYARTFGHGPFTPEQDKEYAWMCDVCHSTLAGNAYLYPRQYEYEVYLISATINWGSTNAILAKIEQLR